MMCSFAYTSWKIKSQFESNFGMAALCRQRARLLSSVTQAPLAARPKDPIRALRSASVSLGELLEPKSHVWGPVHYYFCGLGLDQTLDSPCLTIFLVVWNLWEFLCHVMGLLFFLRQKIKIMHKNVLHYLNKHSFLKTRCCVSFVCFSFAWINDLNDHLIIQIFQEATCPSEPFTFEMGKVASTMQNQIIVNKKTGEELFLHCSHRNGNTTVTIRRMAKKERSGTITMQISAFPTLVRDPDASMVSKPVLIGGHLWRILALRYIFSVYLCLK